MKIFVEKVIREPSKHVIGIALVMVETKHFKNHLSVMLDTKVKENTWIEGELSFHEYRPASYYSKKDFDKHLRYGVEKHNAEEIALIGYDYDGNGNFEYQDECYIRGIIKHIYRIADDNMCITISCKEMEMDLQILHKPRWAVYPGKIIEGVFVIDLIVEDELEK